MPRYKLLDVCDFHSGAQPPKKEWVSQKQDGYVRMLQIRDFTQGDEKFVQYVLDSKKLRKCKKDDLLLSRYGYIGMVLTGLEGAYNVALIKVENKMGINNLYLKYYFESQYFQNYLLSNATARATIAGFNRAELKNAAINIPSKITQQKIVDRLLQVDTLIDKRKEQIDTFNDLIKSKFNEMFNTGGTEISIKDVCTDIVDCPHTTPKYEGKLEYPAIRTTDIKHGYIDWSQMKYVSKDEYEKRTSRIKPQADDIIFSREGFYGNATILPNGYKFCLGQRVMLFRADKEKCIPQYLLYCLMSDDVKRQSDAMNVGSIIAHINIKDAKNFKIKLHPIEKQERFARLVKSINASKEKAQNALNELENTKKAMLKEYFN